MENKSEYEEILAILKRNGFEKIETNELFNEFEDYRKIVMIDMMVFNSEGKTIDFDRFYGSTECKFPELIDDSIPTVYTNRHGYFFMLFKKD